MRFSSKLCTMCFRAESAGDTCLKNLQESAAAGEYNYVVNVTSKKTCCNITKMPRQYQQTEEDCFPNGRLWKS